MLASEHAALARLAHGDLHRLDGVGIFGADIDVAVGGAHRDAGNGHAFDQHEGIAFHDHAVGEGAGIAFVGVADDVFLLRWGVGHRAPFDAGGEARAAAAAQAGGDDLLDDGFRPDGERLLKPLVTAMRFVIFEAARIDDAAILEGEPRLALEPGIVVDDADAEPVRLAVEHAGIEQSIDVARAGPARSRRGPVASPLRPAAPANTCRASRCGRSRHRGRASRRLCGSHARLPRRRRRARRNRGR